MKVISDLKFEMVIVGIGVLDFFQDTGCEKKRAKITISMLLKKCYFRGCKKRKRSFPLLISKHYRYEKKKLLLSLMFVNGFVCGICLL